MTENEPDPKDSIARELGWESFEDAPRTVQRTIEDRKIEISEPFAPLDRGSD
ncbi:hypothetical protein [Natronomonas marina]|uniref:hypothetical protein n=1 Tax=Natronomonas marina TaxID=2961939 RepID=UPI0020C9D939|nr:hypothetical protein [Natronomonas marina]